MADEEMTVHGRRCCRGGAREARLRKAGRPPAGTGVVLALGSAARRWGPSRCGSEPFGIDVVNKGRESGAPPGSGFMPWFHVTF